MLKLKTYIGVIAIVLSAIFQANAETVSQKEASHRAAIFFNSLNGRYMAPPKLVYNGKRLTTDRLFTPFYVYNNPSGGFVIISAENKAFPILAYSQVDSFSPDRMGPALKALLSCYAKEIEYIRYDDRIPEEAIKAWTHFPEYVYQLLNRPYLATDPMITPEESKETIQAIYNSDDAEQYLSTIYTPGQWQEIINDELESRKSVAIGFPDSKGFPTGVVHGHKGDYYRIELDGRNNALMRLNATEFISAPQIASVGKLPDLAIDTEEDLPFAFYDSFIAEQEMQKQAEQARIDNLTERQEPLLRSIGAGHFDIYFPENITLARVYNLSGAMVERFTYKNTDTGHLDISIHPSGFYVVIFQGESGRNYSLKLWR